FNPAMKNVAPVRKSLRMKTFFNMLGPMVNPSFPNHQLVGVFSLEVARIYNYIYQDSGKKFTILHSLDGYDEISLTGPFKVYTNNWERTMMPDDTGLKTLQPIELYGGVSVEDSAKIFIDVLEGNGTLAQESAVLANAAFAIMTIDSGFDFETALERARSSLNSGKALSAFKKLIDHQ
ncbi:MAG TPA: hypothetical protein VJ951_08865, partial [Bacteroidales bacterium]|nr:hypothetical protein [Bacteroidales bacterium]